MNNKFGLICDLLIKVYKKQDRGWRSTGLPDSSKTNYDILKITKHSIDKDDLINILSDEKPKPKSNSGDSSDFFYLPPLDDNPEFIPLLTFRFDFEQKPEDFSYQLHMYTFDSKEGMRSMGFRFEGPHGDEPGHDYYHVQPINKLKLSKHSKMEGSVDWFPDKTPTIPIMATTPVSMLLNMLISLYGAKWVLDLIKGSAINDEEKGPLKELLPNPQEKEKEKKKKKIVADYKKKKSKKR